jgi:hypothetical protein
MEKPHWMIFGPEKSWATALELGGIWGVKQALYPEWKALDPEDRIFFFATKPISAVIGAGRVQNKFIQDKPLWPDEIASNQVIYPFRFEFLIDYVLETDRWKADGLKVPLTISEMRRGINLLLERTVDSLYESFAAKFNYPITQVHENQASQYATSRTEEKAPNHGKIQDLVFQIGRLNRLISEKEYPMEEERLDVVWRRVERSVPTYVFEIQIGGDIYHALGKLKHAYDLWNSNIILVARVDDMKKAEQLLNGTFHEIKGKLKRITDETLLELHRLKLQWVEFEKKIGLL